MDDDLRVYFEVCDNVMGNLNRAIKAITEQRRSEPMTMETRIELTAPQAAWVDWALTGPIAEWGDPEQIAWDKDCSPEAAYRAIVDRDATRLEGTTLVLGDIDPDGEFLSDVLNMLEDVAPDVAGGYGFEEAHDKHGYNAAHAITAKRAECARNAARKIREAIR